MITRTLRLARILASDDPDPGKDDLLDRARDLIDEHADPGDIYGIYWNPKGKKIFVSNGDWAEYDTNALFEALEDLLGEGNVEMDAESQPDNSAGDWLRFDPDSRTPRNF